MYWSPSLAVSGSEKVQGSTTEYQDSSTPFFCAQWSLLYTVEQVNGSCSEIQLPTKVGAWQRDPTARAYRGREIPLVIVTGRCTRDGSWVRNEEIVEIVSESVIQTKKNRRVADGLHGSRVTRKPATRPVPASAGTGLGGYRYGGIPPRTRKPRIAVTSHRGHAKEKMAAGSSRARGKERMAVGYTRMRVNKETTVGSSRGRINEGWRRDPTAQVQIKRWRWDPAADGQMRYGGGIPLRTRNGSGICPRTRKREDGGDIRPPAPRGKLAVGPNRVRSNKGQRRDPTAHVQTRDGGVQPREKRVTAQELESRLQALIDRSIDENGSRETFCWRFKPDHVICPCGSPCVLNSLCNHSCLEVPAGAKFYTFAVGYVGVGEVPLSLENISSTFGA
ncbi:hypothetical protein C8F04DRAFT_1238689 [Mycena alexandri]|uniref:Uncharacterized protein n=1 Tax=Mycena alexandri TaxID=1745969 RepID=A0AAD6SHJ0_9AGAR|nr:hypothetical protein C8F04DRAFT_1238689 [Mycena alexandri]